MLSIFDRYTYLHTPTLFSKMNFYGNTPQIRAFSKSFSDN